MASSYTSNNRIEKIGTGEQAGTWGSTTNTNFDIIDKAINGVGSISLSGTSDDLTTSDGDKDSSGLFKVLKLGGSPSGSHKLRIRPNSVQKLYFVANSSGQTVEIGQIDDNANFSTSTNSVSVANGKTAIIYADGGGATAAKVRSIETGSDEFTEDVTIKTSDGALLTLQTGDTTITDGDVLGALQFQAPDDTDGKTGDADGSKVTASIVGEADATFNADTNSTDLVFKLATDGDAAEKMRLTHEGDLNIITDNKSIQLGADSDTTLTHVADTGILLNSTRQLQFGDSGTYIHQSADGVLDLVADTEIEINATTIDINGAVVCDSVVTATGFTIGSAVITEAELEKLDGITNGAVAANKAVVVDGNKDAGTFRNITASGTIEAGEVTATSDERLKSDIKTIDNALYKVMNMRGVSFTKQAEKGIGVIAQEVEKIIPEVVTDGEYKSVAYGNMVGVLIEAIKDLKKELDEHKQGCNCGS